MSSLVGQVEARPPKDCFIFSRRDKSADSRCSPANPTARHTALRSAILPANVRYARLRPSPADREKRPYRLPTHAAGRRILSGFRHAVSRLTRIAGTGSCDSKQGLAPCRKAPARPGPALLRPFAISAHSPFGILILGARAQFFPIFGMLGPLRILVTGYV